MNCLSPYKAPFLSDDLSRRERIWVYVRLVQVFLSGFLVIKTLLHFMCGWSANIYPIIITNGVILIYTCCSLNLHRRRSLIRPYCFWAINGHVDFTVMVGCIITACMCSLDRFLREGLCGNQWHYCPNRGFHIVWMSFLCIAFALSAILGYWLQLVSDEGRIALSGHESSSSRQSVRSSSIAALAAAVRGNQPMNPDAMILEAADYINSLQGETRMYRAAARTSNPEEASGELGSSSSAILVPDLSEQLGAMMARVEAIERSNNVKE